MGALGEAIAAGGRGDRREAHRPGEDDLVEAARADLLERLSAGLVHEARNPLNAMAIHLELIADKLRSEVTGEVEPPGVGRNLDAARRQVRRLDLLLRQWGEFACRRIEREDLATCLERAVALGEYHLRRAGVAAELEVAPGILLEQPGLVCQAALELLLAMVEGAGPGSLLRVTGGCDEGTIHFTIRSATAGAGETTAGELQAGRVAGAIAERLGGAIEWRRGEDRCWTIRWPAPPVHP